MYTPNFIEIGQTFCERTYGRTDVPTDGQTFPPLMLLGQLGVDLIIIALEKLSKTKKLYGIIVSFTRSSHPL